MKRIIAVAMAFVFVFALSAVAMEGHGKEGHGKEAMPEKCAEHMKMMKDGKMGGMVCGLNADVKVKNTKNGAIIELKAKKDGDSVQAIQEAAKSMEEMMKANPAAAAAAGNDEMVVCPVMGTKIKKSKAYSSYEYKGKTYYFCCAGCPELFKANPEKYIKK